MRVVISDNAADTCQALTEAMIHVLKAIRDRDIYLAVSGGSTPAQLFDWWVRRFEHEIDWKRIQLFWVDERCVPPAEKESNYRMTATHLLSKLPFKDKHIHRIHGEANPPEEALRYEEIVRKLLPWENGIPVFDLILLGIGSDGHTASLFPGEESLSELQNKVCDLTSSSNTVHLEEASPQPIYIVTRKPENGQKRISMTMTLINRARNIFFMATGSEKSKIISDLYHQTPSSYLYPASYVHPVEGKLICFLDREAVSDACYSPK